MSFVTQIVIEKLAKTSFWLCAARRRAAPRDNFKNPKRHIYTIWAYILSKTGSNSMQPFMRSAVYKILGQKKINTNCRKSRFSRLLENSELYVKLHQSRLASLILLWFRQLVTHRNGVGNGATRDVYKILACIYAKLRTLDFVSVQNFSFLPFNSNFLPHCTLRAPNRVNVARPRFGEG